jgi:predicted metal-binding membrane protein
MSTILRFNADRRWSYVITASLVLTAWLILAVWSLSPYAEWLNHAQMEHIGASLTVRLAVFTLGWMLMVIAMMLPSTLPLIRNLGDRSFSTYRIAPFLLAYLMVWTVFGNLSYIGDSMLHEIVEQSPALEGMIAPGVLLLAGIYELTPMKRFCLSKCRPEAPMFRLSGPDRRTLWPVGLQHGLFCLGSCWALMLLMFAIGGVNLFWMVILGAVMAVERLSPRGDNVAQGLGISLIIVSVLLVIV